jgi:fatty-acyl-CoA synthase
MTIPGLLERSAELYRDREALVSGSARLTYRELTIEVRRTANALIGLGVLPRDRVGIWLPNFVEWPVANLAIASIGAITVPINTRLRTEEARYVLRAAGVSVLITTDRYMTNSYLDMLREISPEIDTTPDVDICSAELPALRRVITLSDPKDTTLSWPELLAAAPIDVSPELRSRIDEQRPSDAVNMFWTSGTTANPKGAVAPHRVLEGIAHYAESLGYSSSDRCLASAPLFYTTTNYWVFLVSLMTGACCVLTHSLSIEETLDAIDTERITTVVGMPNMFVSILEHPRLETISTESVRRAWLGGATVTPELIDSLKNRLGLEILVQVYGMTETGGITTMSRIDADSVSTASSVGRPMPNFELRIIDPETLEDIAAGEPGELCVRSPYNLITYYGMSEDELSSSVIEGGWFRTGDLFSRDDAENYFFRGRLKDMIKVGGENVAAYEVEQVLYQHDAVLQTAVVGVPDAKRSEAVVAFVQTSREVTEDQLQAHCRERLATFKRPSKYIFRTEWPLTPTGKIRKIELRQQYDAEYGW